jgi:hypothetical protein
MFRESPLFQFRNGDHTCVFYRSESQLMEVISPFIANGLRRGNRCLCVQKPEVLKTLVFDLRFLGIDTDAEIKRGALDLHVESEIYYPQGKFEPEALMDMLVRSIAKAKADGFTAFRSAGELSWAVEGHFDCDKVVGYEKMVDEYYPGQPAIGLCQYDMNKFPADVLKNVIRSHKLQIADTATDSHHASIHIRRRGVEVEIVANKGAVSSEYHYVVKQSLDPFEIIGWGVERDFDAATHSVDHLLQSNGTEPVRDGEILAARE